VQGGLLQRRGFILPQENKEASYKRFPEAILREENLRREDLVFLRKPGNSALLLDNAWRLLKKTYYIRYPAPTYDLNFLSEYRLRAQFYQTKRSNTAVCLI